MKKHTVAVVGVGAVGTEMIRLLRSRAFPIGELRVLARRERDEEIAGETFHVRPATPEAFSGVDYAFFAGTEGDKGASQTLGWDAVQQGCVVIDNGDDFRMDPRVPLVIPEVNADALSGHQGFIANPNCSTIIGLMALAPLHQAVGIDRVVASTYQAVSGAGSSAVTELEEQVRAWVRGEAGPEPRAFTRPIAFNVLAQIGSLKDDLPGFTSEEVKMERETRKILGDERIRVCSTCVRVPVVNGHSESLNVELKRPLSVEEAREILGAAPGVRVVDDVPNGLYPTPLDCSGTEDVLVGRIRKDPSVENGIALFVSGDNIWKGAALNAIQIGEALLARA